MRDSEEQDMDEQATTTPSPAPPTPAAVVAAADATRSTTPRPQPARILGRNVNGTVVQTSMPQNEAELQLYRVMQRASLLSYYDTLLEMGGDDVQQLCDAGEEEFLEIMALVGMASKPLHVRRLQKALQEWLTNPGMFQTPVLAPPSSSSSCSTASSSTSTAAAAATAVPGKKAATPTAPAAATAVPVVAAPVSAFPGIPPGSYSPKQPSAELLLASSSGISALSSIGSQTAKLAAATASTPSAVNCPSSALTQPAQLVGSSYTPAGCGGLVQRRKSLSPIPFGVTGIMPMQQQPPVQPAGVLAEPSASALPSTLPMSHSPGILQSMNYESSSCGSQGTTPSPGSNCAINAPQSPTAVNVLQMTTPILLESQVQRLAELSERIAAKYRPVNPKPPTGIKKKISKNLETIMAMPDSDPRKMEEIRKYAAIYGRFDCKRKPEKPLTLHEVSVNEAAAQICRFAPILLTRRDELFPLARQVVRHSGHYFNKTYVHTSCMTSPPRRLSSSRENGDGDLSGGDESLLLPGQDLAKKRKLELRCTSEDDSVTGNGDNPSEQTETARLRCVDFSRTSSLGVDSDGIPIQIHQNRHRKRQRRRSRPLKIGHKSTSSPIWQSCSDGSGNIMDGVVDGLEDSDGCYSSFEDDWDDCNGDGCEDNFGIDSEDEDDNEDETASGNTALINDSQMRANLEEDEASCMMDKENDFNLKVIASCGDNIIAVANPALMSRNQPAAIAKEQNIKEEIALRDRRD